MIPKCFTVLRPIFAQLNISKGRILEFSFLNIRHHLPFYSSCLVRSLCQRKQAAFDRLIHFWREGGLFSSSSSSIFLPSTYRRTNVPELPLKHLPLTLNSLHIWPRLCRGANLTNCQLNTHPRKWLKPHYQATRSLQECPFLQMAPHHNYIFQDAVFISSFDMTCSPSHSLLHTNMQNETNIELNIDTCWVLNLRGGLAGKLKSIIHVFFFFKYSDKKVGFRWMHPS